MQVWSEFRFDHEAGDDTRTTRQLDRFQAWGIELGAAVTVWYCARCDEAVAKFEPPPEDCSASPQRPGAGG